METLKRLIPSSPKEADLQENYARIDGIFQHGGTGFNRLFFLVTWLRLCGNDPNLDNVPVYELRSKPHTLPLVVAVEEMVPKALPHFVPTRDDDSEDSINDLDISTELIQWWMNPWNYSVM